MDFSSSVDHTFSSVAVDEFDEIPLLWFAEEHLRDGSEGSGSSGNSEDHRVVPAAHVLEFFEDGLVAVQVQVV